MRLPLSVIDSIRPGDQIDPILIWIFILFLILFLIVILVLILIFFEGSQRLRS
jgi:hypothetical protein